MDTQSDKALNPNPSTPWRPICKQGPKSLSFFNPKTGEYTSVPCKRWDCPVCGVQKKQRLYVAMKRYFMQFKWIRMWTFTFRSNSQYTIEEHYVIMQKAWRIFWKEVRRCPFLTKAQRHVQFVRCLDIHKSGYIHFHCLFTEWILQKTLYILWNDCLSKVTGNSGKHGGLRADGFQGASGASKYVCKYVSKASEQITGHSHRYSRSGKVRLFDIRTNKGEWVIIDLRKILYAQCRPTFEEVLTLPAKISISAQLVLLFSDSS
jgi:hypothetical protein